MIPMPRRLDLLLVLVLSAYASFAISRAWQHPYVLTLLLSWPPVLLGIRLGSPIHAVIFSATGLVLGPLTECLCIASGLWTYSSTGGLPLAPLWILPLWACFPTALWLIVRSLRDPRSPRFSPVHLTLILLGLAITIALCIRFGHSTTLTLLVLSPLALLVLLLTHRICTLLIFASGALIGPLCESLPISTHAWHYATPQILGMPAWLPAGYAIFSVLIALTAEQLSSLATPPRSRTIPPG
jgi:hypothetical protein